MLLFVAWHGPSAANVRGLAAQSPVPEQIYAHVPTAVRPKPYTVYGEKGPKQGRSTLRKRDYESELLERLLSRGTRGNAKTPSALECVCRERLCLVCSVTREYNLAYESKPVQTTNCHNTCNQGKSGSSDGLSYNTAIAILKQMKQSFCNIHV